MLDRHRTLLESMYAAAVAAAAPDHAVRRAIADDRAWGDRPTHVIALGKAAHAMADAAVLALGARGVPIAGGVIVAPDDAPAPHAAIESVRGSHPVPDEASRSAAERLGDAVSRVNEGDEVLALISGGATSLVAAPVDGVSESALVQCFARLLASGADITTMNAIRKRIARWGAGRLAVALAERGAARVRCLIVSDVLGDDPAFIASGPCAGDELTARDVLARIADEGLDAFVPEPVRAWLHDVAWGRASETPKPDDPRLARVSCEVVLGNRAAMLAAGDRAAELGLAPVKIVAAPLDDDAAFTGERLVDELIRFREAPPAPRETADRGSGSMADPGSPPLACMIWGGETTVRLGAGAVPPGGRCQELALSAALALDEARERGEGIAILAAGTDGRDGPTDAAGAAVDARSWSAIRDAGRDPERDLVEHDSHRALDAIGALVRVGSTGTNVGDVVIGIVEIAGGA